MIYTTDCFQPGKLYCVAFFDSQWAGGLRCEGLFWYSADGNWYSAEDENGEPKTPSFDVMIEQIGAINRAFA